MAKTKRIKTRADLMDIAPRAIVHLRSQNTRKRLGLIFGSGASKQLGYPDWSELVSRIANHPDVAAPELIRKFRISAEPPKAGEENSTPKSLASITQMLFANFKEKRLEKLVSGATVTYLDEQKIRSDWLRIIHSQLYRDVDASDRTKRLKDHPYLMGFLDIIKASPLTVNYNFDDTLEQLLLHNRSGKELAQTRGYEITYKPNAQFQKDNSVIYHPNGFLPSTFEDGTSPEVVFSDDAFQDQLVSAATGKYVHLSNHLFRNTCLLIGLSLEDSTLQSLLRQNAVTNPGHIHYIIQYVSPEAADDPDAMHAMFEANFSSYNLYTLFMDSDGINELANLINLSDDQFELDFQDRVRKFVYYVVGSVGAGKSTATGNFRCLLTYDEWIDERRPALAIPESQVDAKEVSNLDTWVVEQFRKKNLALVHSREGIHLIDRCPLDPLTFGDPEKRPEKARNLINKITKSLCPGHIIYLDCDLSELRIRNSFKHRYWPDREYEKLLKELQEVYGPLMKSEICTRGRNCEDVARQIAKIVFLDDYREVDILAELTRHLEATT